MKTDLESDEFKAMLAGEKGLFALDLARDIQEILADNAKLTEQSAKWQGEAELRGDKVSVLIEEKTAITEKHTALKATLAEMAK